jgi:hypothetical protein
MGEENSAQTASDDKLLLETIFKRKSGARLSQYMPFRRLHDPIQGIPLRWGLKATNLGKAPFPGATVKKLIIWSSPVGQSAFVTFDEDFSIPALNPRASNMH